MKRVLIGIALGALAIAVSGVMMTRNEAGAQVKNFDITWIDTEGGAATLMVTPGGERCAGLDDTGGARAARAAP